MFVRFTKGEVYRYRASHPHPSPRFEAYFTEDEEEDDDEDDRLDALVFATLG